MSNGASKEWRINNKEKRQKNNAVYTLLHLLLSHNRSLILLQLANYCKNCFIVEEQQVQGCEKTHTQNNKRLLIIDYVRGYITSSPAARNNWRQFVLNELIGQFGSMFLMMKFQHSSGIFQHYYQKFNKYSQGSFWVWARPIRGGITM